MNCVLVCSAIAEWSELESLRSKAVISFRIDFFASLLTIPRRNSPRWLAPPQPVHKIRWHCSDVGYVICRFKKKCTCLQGCQIFLETYQNGKNIHTQWPQIYQMAVKYNICPYIIHNFLFQGLPKYTKIGICGMKYTIWQPCILTWPLYKIGKKF
jgi:hypothetical protein